MSVLGGIVVTMYIWGVVRWTQKICRDSIE